MSIASLLERLDGVRKVGPGRWIAKCPAHDDKHPSLSIRELADGRILLHDFGGCGTDSVLSAVSLTMSDLFPARVDGYSLSKPPRLPAIDILACIGNELAIVTIAARDLADGYPLNDADHERLNKAANRLQKAVGLTNGFR